MTRPPVTLEQYGDELRGLLEHADRQRARPVPCACLAWVIWAQRDNGRPMTLHLASEVPDGRQWSYLPHLPICPERKF